MVWKAAAGVIVAGTILAGCAPKPADTPKASAAGQPMDEGAVSTLEQSWRASHPGSLIGHVNAVAPDRHILSVTGLPLDQIHEGDIVTILPNGQTNNVISAKVFGKENGFAQLEYSGGAEPRQGDLAIWYTAAANDEASTAAGTNAALPTTQPGATVPEMPAPAPTTPTPAPTPTAPPETTPPPPTTPAPTPPAPTTPAPTPPPAPGNGTPTAPPTPPADNKLPSDLNK
jgi:hypothetical protein